MIRRAIATLAVLLVATLPAVRAFCGVSCGASARHQQPAPVEHCSGTQAPASSPAPAGACHYHHVQSLTSVNGTSLTPSYGPVTIVAAVAATWASLRWSSLTTSLGRSLQPPGATRHLPLRI
jgi:hypothetical protein